MAYEIVKKIKCIKTTNKDGEQIEGIAIGNIYDQVFCNAGRNNKLFAIFNDYGQFQELDSELFEIIKTKTRENTGWEIKCLDCSKELTIEEFKKGKCPKCGQKI